MYKELLVEVLGVVSVGHVGFIARRTVEVFHSLLSDDNSEWPLKQSLHIVSVQPGMMIIWE